jgi:AraC family transcriptional regulator
MSVPLQTQTQTQNREHTLEAWRARMQRVTEWLVTHLDQPFDLERLAELAHFSPYHFHRIYTVVMGEPVAETVRRMRLHRAAVELAASNTSTAVVAKRAGYGSVQAFGRAFRESYGAAPVKYRQHAQTSLALIRQSQQTTHPKPIASVARSFPSGLGTSPGEAVRIVHLKALRAAAMPHKGSYNTIGDSFQKLMAWAVGRDLPGLGSQMLGLYYDDPDALPERELKSDACISVPDDFQLAAQDAPVHLTQTSAGRCAQAVFTGPYAQLHTAYAWLYHVWLPQSGEQPRNQPPMETYLNDPRANPPALWQTAISIPLED